MNHVSYTVSASFNDAYSQNHQSFCEFSGYHILHPDFKINIGADATETSMVLRYIGLTGDQLACRNGQIILDIPLQLAIRNERQTIVYTLPVDLQEANGDYDVCMTGATTTAVFIEYTDLSKRLQAGEVYSFEINSPQADQSDFIIPIGTFEYRDGSFNSTGNIN